MSLQFIIGGSGSGKTRTLYENLIRQSMEEPDGRFFALVPEQFTMQTQKEIVMLHPNHGVMNIDIVSFERLAYRVFEELAIENLAVLDDMGKSMVLRRVSSGVRGNLHLFGGHLDKAGFISEIKSMLSEFFQYGITEEKLETLIGETKSPLLRQKLLDMQASADNVLSQIFAQTFLPEIIKRFIIIPVPVFRSFQHSPNRCRHYIIKFFKLQEGIFQIIRCFRSKKKLHIFKI